MPVLCSSKCGKNAILKRPKTGDALCKDCFFWAFETEIHHSICKGNLFKKGQTVAIAASGGKDSTVLAYVLKVLNERYNYGLNLQLLSIDEGITGYRDDSLTTVKRNKDDYAMPLKVLSYEELYGWTMDAIVAQIGKKNNCTFCGVFRRQALDRGAAMLGVDVVATGHNADDIAETVIMNVLRGDIARLHRCTAISTENEGSIPRVKPLKYTYEKEIVMYAYFKKLVYFSTECVYAPNAYRGHAREYLKDLEKIRPTSILDVIHSGEQFAVKEGITLAKRGTCSRCGFVSSQLVCKACVLLEGLNKGLPKLCIGKSNKLSRMEFSRLTLNSTDLKKEHSDLYQPSLDELTKVVYAGLQNYFEEVNVEVVDCPNLIQKPFNLASQGLGGNPTLLEVGGPPYLLPLCNKDKIYDLRTLVESLGMKQCFVVGAGAGPWFYAGKNCEMMANAYFSERESRNLTYIAKVAEPKNKIQLEVVPDSETRFALLANLFCCKGKPGKVLKVSCKKRTGEENFISAIRLALEKEFQEKPVGLGGVFLIKSGKARHHVMPDFSNVPLNSDEELNKWLRFFELSAPLVAVGTLVSSPIQGLDLRLQHFHCFSEHGVGGHYHNDTTPQEVEYEGYFNLAESIYRVDKPVDTHKFGRD